MLIDVHAHIWKGTYRQNREELLKAAALYDITKIYVSGLGGVYPDKDEIDELNLEVYKFMAENKNSIEGYCYVNPANANSLAVLKNGVEKYGMAGMKLWVATLCDHPSVFPLVEKCIDYRIPMLIHAFHKAIGQLEYESLGTNVAKLAERYPEAKIIMAHLGGNCYNGIKPIRNCKNVYVDISGSLFRRDELDYTVKQLGHERILFGTDMIGSFLVNLGQVEEADLTRDQKAMIFYNNALRIFDRSLLQWAELT